MFTDDIIKLQNFVNSPNLWEFSELSTIPYEASSKINVNKTQDINENWCYVVFQISSTSNMYEIKLDSYFIPEHPQLVVLMLW